MFYLAHQLHHRHGVQENHLHTLQLQINLNLFLAIPTDSANQHLTRQNACFAGVNMLKFVR